MTFAIDASKDGHITQTLRIDPEVAVAKARDLLGRGWEVHITDQAGRRYRPEAFDRLCRWGSGRRMQEQLGQGK
jgi:hypothetical protein